MNTIERTTVRKRLEADYYFVPDAEFKPLPQVEFLERRFPLVEPILHQAAHSILQATGCRDAYSTGATLDLLIDVEGDNVPWETSTDRGIKRGSSLENVRIVAVEIQRGRHVVSLARGTHREIERKVFSESSPPVTELQSVLGDAIADALR